MSLVPPCRLIGRAAERPSSTNPLDPCPFAPEGDRMAVPIAVASTVLAVILVIVLAREIRLRRALESLLRRLLTYWRTHAHTRVPDADRPAAPDDWLPKQHR
jgi:hypothetical protein